MKTSATIARAGLLTLAMGFAGGLFMASSTPASATTCAGPVGYNTYNPAPPGPSITCTIDNLQFSTFGFSSSATGGATLPTASGVTVTPITTPLNEGFTFNPGLSVATQPGPTAQAQDVTIMFEVTGLNGTLINDLSIFFNGSFSGTGTTNFSETYCTGSFTTGCNNFQVQNPPTNLSNHINITPTTTLFITKDVAVNSGTSGSASVSVFDNQFSQVVPIPGALPLFATGLVGLWAVRRRRKADAAVA